MCFVLVVFGNCFVSGLYLVFFVHWEFLAENPCLVWLCLVFALHLVCIWFVSCISCTLTIFWQKTRVWYMIVFAIWWPDILCLVWLCLVWLCLVFGDLIFCMVPLKRTKPSQRGNHLAIGAGHLSPGILDLVIWTWWGNWCRKLKSERHQLSIGTWYQLLPGIGRKMYLVVKAPARSSDLRNSCHLILYTMHQVQPSRKGTI